MTTLSPSTSQAEIMTRAIERRPEGLPLDAARYFLSLRLDERDEARANELAEKARQGALSEMETLELDEYRRCLRFMDLIKLKARLALKQVA